MAGDKEVEQFLKTDPRLYGVQLPDGTSVRLDEYSCDRLGLTDGPAPGSQIFEGLGLDPYSAAEIVLMNVWVINPGSGLFILRVNGYCRIHSPARYWAEATKLSIPIKVQLRDTVEVKLDAGAEAVFDVFVKRAAR